MSESNDFRIRVEPLPPRAVALGDEEVSKVFGGCAGKGDLCIRWGAGFQDNNCCGTRCCDTKKHWWGKDLRCTDPSSTDERVNRCI